MEACAPGLHTRGLMFLAVLSLIKPTAGAFTSSTLGTESYASTGTGDSDTSTAFLTGVSADLSTGVSTDLSAGVSTDLSAGVSTDLSAGVSTDFSTGVSTGVSAGVSTDLSTGVSTGVSTDFSTGVSTDFSTGVSTDFSTGVSAGVSTDLSAGVSAGVSTDLSTDLSAGVSTDLSAGVSTGVSTDLSTGVSTDLSAGVSPASKAASLGHTSTSKSKALHPIFYQRESHTATDQSSSTEVMDKSWKGWTTENRSDMSTDLPDSSSAFSTNTVTEFEDPSTVANITDAYTVAEREQHTSEYRTMRDLTVTKLTKQEQSRTDQDTTESGSNSDSTYISTTSRAGERTLLSIISNSTSTYVEDTSSSISRTHDITGPETETGVTQHMESSEDGVSTQSVHSTATSDDLSTNATQGEGVNTKDSLGSGITQFRTGQPTVTGTNFESMAKTSNPSSTPPLTVINSSDSEVDITANSSTNQDYTDISSSSSFVPPLVSEITHTSVSHRYIETSTGPVITSTDEKPSEPMTFKEETTIPGLTVVPSTLWDITTSVDESQSTQQTFISQTNSPPEPTTVLSTHAEPSTRMPPLTVEDKHKGSTVPVTSTTLDGMGTTAVFTTHQFQASTTTEAQSTPHSTLSATETTKKTAPTTEKHHPTTGTATPSLSASSSQSGPGATDVSTLHFENSTATPGRTTSHRQHTTASYNKTTSTTSTAAISTGNHTATKATTTEMPEKLSLTPGHMCKPQMCANGGKCVLMPVGYRCECLPGWRGENCTEDVDECASNPCPQKSKCVNTRGSFSCYCDFGYDMQDGRSCTKTKTFLVIFSINGSLHDSHTEILQLLNASLSNLHGYRRSTLLNLESLEILTMNMFSMSANVTRNDIFQRIQTSITNCNSSQSHCSLKLQYQLPYQVLSLCLPQDKRCDTEYGVWNDTDGTPYCQCHEEYFKNKQRDSTPRDCGNGFKLVNGTCIECPFGFGGFNCNNFYELIAKVVSPAAGGLLLIIIIALIIACCRKDKNDINKIIFKSGDLPMSPCGEFPKSNRVSMEWGRETIEMQENGSTKNLLQMTDIYYSPALRNADLERNGLYPFLGLPGSRHSCIYPAQWNPSFINDDTRRRDYF